MRYRRGKTAKIDQRIDIGQTRIGLMGRAARDRSQHAQSCLSRKDRCIRYVEKSIA